MLSLQPNVKQTLLIWYIIPINLVHSYICLLVSWLINIRIHFWTIYLCSPHKKYVLVSFLISCPFDLSSGYSAVLQFLMRLNARLPSLVVWFILSIKSSYASLFTLLNLLISFFFSEEPDVALSNLSAVGTFSFPTSNCCIPFSFFGP